jgi:hypothetical protein
MGGSESISAGQLKSPLKGKLQEAGIFARSVAMDAALEDHGFLDGAPERLLVFAQQFAQCLKSK